MKTNIGISEANTAEVAHELCKILADEFVLYTKAKNAHWNIEGSDFMNKHLFFETQYNQLQDIVDNVAERIRQLGHYAPATLEERICSKGYMRRSDLLPRPGPDYAGLFVFVKLKHSRNNILKTR